MNHEAAVKILVKCINSEFESNKNLAAEHFNVTVTHLNRIINAGHAIPKNILDHLGLERCEIEYRRVKH